MRALLICVCTLLLVACSQKISGTYSDKNGMFELTVTSPERFILKTYNGNQSEISYRIEGDQIKIIAPNGKERVLTIQNDGSIAGVHKDIILFKQKS